LDPFAVIMTVIVGGLLLILILLGVFYPGSGARQLDWKPTRSAEVEVQNEIDDLDQMLEAANERRRKRGAAELTEDTLHAQVRDPDRIGTVRSALANVTVLLWALGTVDAPELHGSRLEMMLEKTIDTMVRGVIYERGGGEAIVERMCALNEVPWRIVEADAPD